MSEQERGIQCTATGRPGKGRERAGGLLYSQGGKGRKALCPSIGVQSVEIEYKDLFLYRVDSKEGLRKKKVSRLLLSVTLSF